MVIPEPDFLAVADPQVGVHQKLTSVAPIPVPNVSLGIVKDGAIAPCWIVRLQGQLRLISGSDQDSISRRVAMLNGFDPIKALALDQLSPFKVKAYFAVDRAMDPQIRRNPRDAGS